MSTEAARIISSIKSNVNDNETSNHWIGTVSSVSPVTLKLEDVDFPVSEGLLINDDIKGTIATGDKVFVTCISNACHIILCKVVSI